MARKGISMNKRPDVLDSKTRKMMVGCGAIYVTVCYKDDARYKEPPINEVWIEPSFKAKDDEDFLHSCIKSFTVPLSRLITFIIRHEPPDDKEKYRADLIRQLHNHTCPKTSVVCAKSCIDAVARVLLCEWNEHKYKEGRCWVCGLMEKVQ